MLTISLINKDSKTALFVNKKYNGKLWMITAAPPILPMYDILLLFMFVCMFLLLFSLLLLFWEVYFFFLLHIIKKILDSPPLERVSAGFLSYLHLFTQYNPCFIHVLWCRYKLLSLFLFECQTGVSFECDNVQVTIEAV